MNKRQAKKNMKKNHPKLYEFDLWLKRVYEYLKPFKLEPIVFAHPETYNELGIRKAFNSIPESIGGITLNYSKGSYKLSNGAVIDLYASGAFHVNDIKIMTSERTKYRYYPYETVAFRDENGAVSQSCINYLRDAAEASKDPIYKPGMQYHGIKEDTVDEQTTSKEKEKEIRHVYNNIKFKAR